MTNLGMLSMRLNMNRAANSGKPCVNRRLTSSMLTRRDFSVSSSASGTVTSTNEATAATAMPIAAISRLRVMSSSTAKTATTSTERSAWLMPAR